LMILYFVWLFMYEVISFLTNQLTGYPFPIEVLLIF